MTTRTIGIDLAIRGDHVAQIYDDGRPVGRPTPCAAPRAGQKTFVLGGQEMLLRPNIGIFTQPISCIGLPVVAVPVWPEDGGLPFGVQVIAAPHREDLALRVAHRLEQTGLARAPVAGSPA